MVLRRGIPKTWLFNQKPLYTYNNFHAKTMFLDSSTQNHAESFRNFIKDLVLDPKHGKFTKSLVSGIWFLSPEAGGTLRRQLGEPGRAVQSTCPLTCCIRTLERYLKVSLVRESNFHQTLNFTTSGILFSLRAGYHPRVIQSCSYTNHILGKHFSTQPDQI